MPRETVKFRKEEGTISIEVTSGFGSIGGFVLAYKKKGDPKYTEFGKDPKRIDDDVPDLFMIPVDEDEIENYRVVIMGKYAPGVND